MFWVMTRRASHSRCIADRTAGAGRCGRGVEVGNRGSGGRVPGGRVLRAENQAAGRCSRALTGHQSRAVLPAMPVRQPRTCEDVHLCHRRRHGAQVDGLVRVNLERGHHVAAQAVGKGWWRAWAYVIGKPAAGAGFLTTLPLRPRSCPAPLWQAVHAHACQPPLVPFRQLAPPTPRQHCVSGGCGGVGSQAGAPKPCSRPHLMMASSRMDTACTWYTLSTPIFSCRNTPAPGSPPIAPGVAEKEPSCAGEWCGSSASAVNAPLRPSPACVVQRRGARAVRGMLTGGPVSRAAPLLAGSMAPAHAPYTWQGPPGASPTRNNSASCPARLPGSRACPPRPHAGT